MQRWGLTTRLSMSTAYEKKAYEELFEADPTSSNVEALAALFTGTRPGCDEQETATTNGRLLSRSIARFLVV